MFVRASTSVFAAAAADALVLLRGETSPNDALIVAEPAPAALAARARAMAASSEEAYAAACMDLASEEVAATTDPLYAAALGTERSCTRYPAKLRSGNTAFLQLLMCNYTAHDMAAAGITKEIAHELGLPHFAGSDTAKFIRSWTR